MVVFYIEHEYWFAVFQLVLAMLGMGATLTTHDFRAVLLQPKAVSSGIGIQVLLVPFVAFVFIQAFGVTGGVAIGVALIAAIPGGATSNIFTFFARGNVALSITITALTTVACLVTAPLILRFLSTQYLPATFVMPRADMVIDIALALLFPLAVGMGYLRFLPDSAAAFSRWSIRGSLIGLILIVLGSLMSGRLDIEMFGVRNFALIALLIFMFATSSWLVCRIVGLSSFDSTAINIEVVVRNVNLGLMLKAMLFPAILGQPDPIGDMVLVSLISYGSMHMVVAAALIGWRRRKGHH
ncbi:bile acid:sodium symporter family protein [Erythrobacter sp. QSSC1-22B]|uniref:bile acid:sodium symporter family protein n=1 Tax=Erythrobacter sp. QSSC1-22B TaxID=1860125 RepID=UPI0009F32A18|nr:bile acid:sodium symporter [Erythrobacter sp. QSSC1-22B]